MITFLLNINKLLRKNLKSVKLLLCLTNSKSKQSNNSHFDYIPIGILNTKNPINIIVHTIRNAIEYGNISFIMSPKVYSGLYFFINTRIISAYDIRGDITLVEESAILYAADTISGVNALFT